MRWFVVIVSIDACGCDVNIMRCCVGFEFRGVCDDGV